MRSGHLHTRPRPRSYHGEDAFDDSDYDDRAADIVYWRCAVCSVTYTDEKYPTLYGGILEHLKSPHHTYMRRKKRHPGMPWTHSIRLFLHHQRSTYPLGLLAGAAAKGMSKGWRGVVPRINSAAPPWWCPKQCDELHYDDGVWRKCNGFLYASCGHWRQCSSEECARLCDAVIEDHEIRIVTKWRHRVYRQLVHLVATKRFYRWKDSVADRWKVLIVESLISHMKLGNYRPFPLKR